MKRRTNKHGYLSNDSYTRKQIRKLSNALNSKPELDEKVLTEDDKQLIKRFKAVSTPKDLREIEKRGLTNFI